MWLFITILRILSITSIIAVISIFTIDLFISVLIGIKSISPNTDKELSLQETLFTCCIPGFEGRKLKGIHFAMSFLSKWQSKQMSLNGNKSEYDDALLASMARGKDVVVIGGGDTGNDCIGTSLRQVCIQRHSTAVSGKVMSADTAFDRAPSPSRRLRSYLSRQPAEQTLTLGLPGPRWWRKTTDTRR